MIKKYTLCTSCQTRFNTNFCPECGTPYNYDNVDEIIFETYLYDNCGENEEIEELKDQYGISNSSDLGNKLNNLNYEVKITYKITNEDDVIPIKINVGDGKGDYYLVNESFLKNEDDGK